MRCLKPAMLLSHPDTIIMDASSNAHPLFALSIRSCELDMLTGLTTTAVRAPVKRSYSQSCSPHDADCK